MRALAEFTMRGRMQATLALAGSAVVPLLFWLSAAAGSLVLLRRGIRRRLRRPGLGGATGDVLVVPGRSEHPSGPARYPTLAQILRASTSWSHVLLGSVAVGVVFALVLGHTSSERSAPWRRKSPRS